MRAMESRCGAVRKKRALVAPKGSHEVTALARRSGATKEGPRARLHTVAESRVVSAPAERGCWSSFVFDSLELKSGGRSYFLFR